MSVVIGNGLSVDPVGFPSSVSLVRTQGPGGGRIVRVEERSTGEYPGKRDARGGYWEGFRGSRTVTVRDVGGGGQGEG